MGLLGVRQASAAFEQKRQSARGLAHSKIAATRDVPEKEFTVRSEGLLS
jgi:hypothetical protein